MDNVLKYTELFDYYGNLLTEKEKISQRREKILDLLAEGLTQKEIYTLMNISKRTCINNVNFLKGQGLI